jgi:HK97 gp10 family phage protein
MANITGFQELSVQLKAMGEAAEVKTLRAAAMSALLPALRAAQAAAPVGEPPYGPYESRGGAPFDPYPKQTYKGRKVAPGFTARNIARRSYVDRRTNTVHAQVGVRPEAFYAVQFIELGTSKIAKRPWLEPAFRASIPQVDERLQTQLKARIDKAAQTGKA